jgi:hypothetical protein
MNKENTISRHSNICEENVREIFDDGKEVAASQEHKILSYLPYGIGVEIQKLTGYSRTTIYKALADNHPTTMKCIKVRQIAKQIILSNIDDQGVNEKHI